MHTKGIIRKKRNRRVSQRGDSIQNLYQKNINLLPKLFNQPIFDRRTLASSDTTL